MKKSSVLDSIPTTAEVTKNGKPVIPSLTVPGDLVSRYANAVSIIKDAERTKQEIAPILQERGLGFVFSHNCDTPDKPISSVNLVSSDEGSRVQFTWAKRDLKNDPTAVQAAFEAFLDVDGNSVRWQDYLTWDVTAKFDAKAFLTRGKFDDSKYKAFQAAIAGVCAEFNIDNPLSLTKALVPKDDFHQRRFVDFDLTTNLKIAGILPNTLTLEASI